MTDRNFAQLMCSLPDSEKMRGLASDTSRLAYIYAHLSKFCGYSGLFKYPKVIWAYDVGISVKEINTVIDDLVQASLIEYEHDQQIIRITKWFHKKNVPSNGDHMLSQLRKYVSSDMKSSLLYCSSVAEFLVGCVNQAQTWPVDGKGMMIVQKKFTQQLRLIHRAIGDRFLEAVANEINDYGKGVSDQISAIYPALGNYQLYLDIPPCDHPVESLPTQEEEKRKDKKEKKEKHLDFRNHNNEFSNSKKLERVNVSEQSEDVLQPGTKFKGAMPSKEAKNSNLAIASRQFAERRA